MDEEEILKMEFINENIIEKGIDLEDITNYVKNKTGEEFDSLSFEQLENMVNSFNQDKENGIIASDNKAEKTTKKEEEPKKSEDEEQKKEIPKDEQKECPKDKEQAKTKEIDSKEKPKEMPKEEEKKEIKKEEPKQIEEEKTKEMPKEENKEKNKEIQNVVETPKKEVEIKPKVKAKERQQIKKEISSVNNQDGLYYPEDYEFKTDIQQKNKLLELFKNNNVISIIISDPKKLSGGFFSKNIYSYRVQCKQLNSDVRRTYEDFEWFRNKLLIRYPLRLIPPVMKESLLKQIGNILKIESEDVIEQRKIRYLNKFINVILQKKILRTSPIFHEFLSLNEDDFKKYRNQLDSKKFELEITLKNLITTRGKIKCSLENNSIEGANEMINKYSSLSDLYSKIDSSINNIINDYNNLNAHMYEISSYFDLLNQNLKENNYNNIDNISNNFNELKNMFNSWSMSFGKQSEFFNKEFKEYFNYMALEVNEMSSIYKKYIEFKKEYEDFSSMINKRKEDLFNSQNYEKWEMHPSKINDINTFKLNKKLAFENMLYKENKLLKEEKKRVCVTIYKMNKQYDKLMKIHDERIQKIFDSMNKNIKISFYSDKNISS